MYILKECLIIYLPIFKACLYMCVQLLQSCPSLCNPMDRSQPGSSVCGILQARILEWVAMSSPGDRPSPGIELNHFSGRFFTSDQNLFASCQSPSPFRCCLRFRLRFLRKVPLSFSPKSFLTSGRLSFSSNSFSVSSSNKYSF